MISLDEYRNALCAVRMNPTSGCITAWTKSRLKLPMIFSFGRLGLQIMGTLWILSTVPIQPRPWICPNWNE